MPEQVGHYEVLSDRVRSQVRARVAPMLVAITGPPGSGKSTLAKRLARDLPRSGHAARYCPMDGFHLTNAQLDSRDLRRAKGRIDTFDGEAFNAAVFRLAKRESFWWPLYSRELHEPIPEGTRIDGTEALYVIEGNYILDLTEPWRSAGEAYDLRVFVEVPDDVLEFRLRRRHARSGRSMQETLRKICEVDLPNARRIRDGLGKADIVYCEAANG